MEKWTCNPRLWVWISAPAEIVYDWGTEPPTAPRRRTVGCPLLQVCVHLDGLNAENTFHCWLYSV